jgi:DNA polymerase sigma
MIERFE